MFFPALPGTINATESCVEQQHVQRSSAAWWWHRWGLGFGDSTVGLCFLFLWVVMKALIEITRVTVAVVMLLVVALITVVVVAMVVIVSHTLTTQSASCDCGTEPQKPFSFQWMKKISITVLFSFPLHKNVRWKTNNFGSNHLNQSTLRKINFIRGLWVPRRRIPIVRLSTLGKRRSWSYLWKFPWELASNYATSSVSPIPLSASCCELKLRWGSTSLRGLINGPRGLSAIFYHDAIREAPHRYLDSSLPGSNSA